MSILLLTNLDLLVVMFPVTEIHKQVERLLMAGKAPREIRKVIPTVTGPEISRIRKRLGLSPFPQGRPVGYKNQDVADLVRKLKILGLSYKQIGNAFGFSHQRAQQYILKQRPHKGQEVKKPKFCECCGELGTLHRHHDDYTSDTVRFLCLSCHAKQHKPKRK